MFPVWSNKLTTISRTIPLPGIDKESLALAFNLPRHLARYDFDRLIDTLEFGENHFVMLSAIPFLLLDLTIQPPHEFVKLAFAI